MLYVVYSNVQECYYLNNKNKCLGHNNEFNAYLPRLLRSPDNCIRVCIIVTTVIYISEDNFCIQKFSLQNH